MEWWFREAETTTNLMTLDGSNIRVLDPGCANDGPGPDVFAATLILDDRKTSGDVEFHWRARDWYTHGHEGDVRYDGVLLHVVVEEGGGPDLPLLRVPLVRLGLTGCLARRSPEQNELHQAALARLIRKRRHWQAMELAIMDRTPLWIVGMAEVMAAGPDRATLLHEWAGLFGLHRWPVDVRWRGSRRSQRRMPPSPHRLVNLIREEPFMDPPAPFAIFEEASSWLDDARDRLQCRGFSRSQVREWCINVAIPVFSAGTSLALSLWQQSGVARHYGLERRLSRWWACQCPTDAAEQQAWIHWYQTRCVSRRCQSCSLTQHKPIRVNQLKGCMM